MKLSYKRKRIIIGIMMMYAFLSICYQLEFFFRIALKYDEWYVTLGALFIIYWHMWVPSIMCIILTYLILMRVLPYREKNGRLEKHKL